MLHMIAEAPGAHALICVIQRLQEVGAWAGPNRRGCTPYALAKMRTDLAEDDLKDLCDVLAASTRD